MKSLVLLFSIVALCAGCTTVSVHKAPSVDLSQYKRVYVEQPLNENHHVDEMMTNELQRLGRSAGSGPLTMMPDNADAVITYEGRWSGDFKTNLIDLGISVHTPNTNKILAQARYYQPSAWPKPADVVVHNIITQLFAK